MKKLFAPLYRWVLKTLNLQPIPVQTIPQKPPGNPLARNTENTFQLTLTKEVCRILHRLQQRTEDKDLAAIMRRALWIYDGLSEVVTNEGKIIIRYPDGADREIDIFEKF